MSEFNFKSAICTSREQSERLLALGLKKETADMCSVVDLVSNNGKTIEEVDTIFSFTPDDWEDFGRHVTPRWSLHRLLCLLPKRVQVYDEVWKFKRNLYLSIDEDFNIRYEENVDEPCFDKIFWAYDIYKNCVEAIEWLIKEGYFNKEYLV